MTQPKKSAKNSWLGDFAPIGLAVLVVAAAVVGFRLLYSGEAVSQEAIVDAQREAFLKQHYPNDLSSAKEPARSVPPLASSR